jgi:peptidoglycan/xylan/chitin deacetylase (PgdA/CDA1 family)
VSKRLFVFRWDVDHRVCITDGIPRIRTVCRELGTPHTFFVNLGRSTNLRAWLGKGLERSRAKLGDMEAIHLIQKTGWPRFVLETILSRPVGLSFIPELQALQADGHELGLHGGMDHVVWSRQFSELPAEVIEADVRESYDHFVKAFGTPAGFSAPGFRSDDRLMLLLDRLGFRYNGDAIGGESHPTMVGGRELSHWTIPVTLAGPRTIPFLEYHRAIGTAEPKVLDLLDRHLAERDVAVLYGHPCFEGVEDRMLRKVLRLVLDRGFTVVTLGALAEHIRAEGVMPRAAGPA